MSDLISRQAAIDAIDSLYFDTVEDHDRTKERIKRLSSAQPKRCEDCENFSKTRLLIPQPEIIRCKDCRWWDKYGDYDNGYCMAAKHGYWSEHWDISIRRTYKGDFYCADAEPKGEQE